MLPGRGPLEPVVIYLIYFNIQVVFGGFHGNSVSGSYLYMLAGLFYSLSF